MGGKVSTSAGQEQVSDPVADGANVDVSGSSDVERTDIRLPSAKVKNKISDKSLRIAQKTARKNTKNLEPDSSQNDAMETPSPLKIRQRQLEELREARPHITAQQMDTIKTTWKILQDKIADVGTDIFDRMFESYPDVKGAFGSLRSMSSEDTRYSQEIKAHGRRVLGTLELVITNSNNPELVINHLHDLGHKHITFNAKVEYMDLISQMFLFAVEPVLKEYWTPEAELAWSALFKFIIHLMKESMML